MATIADLNVRLGADSTRLMKELNKAAREFRQKSREMAELADNMFAAVTLPLLGLGAASIKSAADIERLTNAMTSTMGSAEAAGKEIELLRQAAMAPGLEFEQAVKGSVRLQSVGISAEESRRALSAFGNALALAGGTAEQLDGVTLALTQIAAKGKVSAEEINQLAERVPQIRIAMKDAFGTANTEELQKMGITSEEFISKIITSFEKLPKATGGLTESLANFATSLKLTFAKLGNSINTATNFQETLNSLANTIAGLANWFSELSPWVQKLTIYVALALTGIAAYAKAIAALNGVKALYIDNIKLLVTQKASLVLSLNKAKAAFMALDTTLKATVIGAITAAVVALGLALYHYAGQTTNAERATKALADAQIVAKQAIVEEEMRVDSLIKTIQDETAARADKQAAIAELQKIAPQIFGNLTTERDLTQQLVDGKKAYIETLLKQAEAEAIYNALVEKKQKLVSISTKSDEAQLNTFQQITKAFTYLGGAQQAFAYEQATIAKNTKAAEDALKSEITVLEERLNLLNAPVAQVKEPGGSAGGGGGKNPEADKAKTTASVILDLTRKYEDAAIKAQLFGEESGLVAERSGLLKDAIGELLEMGLSPTSAAVQLLSDRWQTLNGNVTALPAAFEGITSASEPILETVATISEGVKTAADYFGTFGDAMEEAGKAGAESMVELAASGETSFKKLGKAALKSAAQVIKAKIMSGVAAVVEDVMQKSGIASLVLAPLAGAAAGMIFNTALKALKIPALAKGGLAYSPQLAMVGDNPGAATDPEVIAPLSKLQGLMGRSQEITGVVRVSGSDLLIMLENAHRNQKRYGT